MSHACMYVCVCTNKIHCQAAIKCQTVRTGLLCIFFTYFDVSVLCNMRALKTHWQNKLCCFVLWGLQHFGAPVPIIWLYALFVSRCFLHWTQFTKCEYELLSFDIVWEVIFFYYSVSSSFVCFLHSLLGTRWTSFSYSSISTVLRKWVSMSSSKCDCQNNGNRVYLSVTCVGAFVCYTIIHD